MKCGNKTTTTTSKEKFIVCRNERVESHDAFFLVEKIMKPSRLYVIRHKITKWKLNRERQRCNSIWCWAKLNSDCVLMAKTHNRGEGPLCVFLEITTIVSPLFILHLLKQPLLVNINNYTCNICALTLTDRGFLSLPSLLQSLQQSVRGPDEKIWTAGAHAINQ